MRKSSSQRKHAINWREGLWKWRLGNYRYGYIFSTSHALIAFVLLLTALVLGTIFIAIGIEGIALLLGISLMAVVTLNGRLGAMPPGSEVPLSFIPASFITPLYDEYGNLYGNHITNGYRTVFNPWDENLRSNLFSYGFWGSLIVSIIAAIAIFLRYQYILKCGSYYESKEDVEEASPSERVALQCGLDYGLDYTWKGYFTSFKQLEACLHPVAFTGAYKHTLDFNRPVVDAIRKLKT